MFKFVFKYISIFILSFLGYSLPNKQTIKLLNNIDKAVFIYPHTSYFDFFLCILYNFAIFTQNNNSTNSPVYIIVNQKAYNSIHPKISKYLNILPATPKETNNGGFINKTLETFQNLSKYNILISPEGTLKSVPWRSGYYVLSKQLNIPIYITGFDYCKHTLKVYGPFKALDTFELTNESIYPFFSKITPLHISGSYVKINNKYNTPTAIDLLTLSSLLSPLLYIYKIYYVHIYEFYLSVICYILSYLYHYHHESKYYIIEPISVISILSLYTYNVIKITDFNVYNLTNFNNNTTLFFISLSISIYYYVKGFGRRCHKHRGTNYCKNHTLFHLWIGISLAIPYL